MSLPRNLQEVVEWRGIKDLVAAEVLYDDAEHGYVTGNVFSIAGVANLEKSVDSSDDAHYYDNQPMVVISSTSADTVTIDVSAIPFDVLAAITGQFYDETTGAMIEGERNPSYFAIGYNTQNTAGESVYVWRYKGKFNIPNSSHATMQNDTTANGQQIVYTGITTTTKFNSVTDKMGNPIGAKALNINASKTSADVTEFFDTVTTPDDLSGAVTKYEVSYSLGGAASSNKAAAVASGDAYETTITAPAGKTLGTVYVYMGGVDVSSTAVTGGAVSIASVTGDVAIIASIS
ncbi:MAG: hypothetical protein J6T97_03625 [Bacteroidaceae bacterium]|uniref:major tail protein n=1 Tax=Ruminococcus sp. TaxID=41978 RepID=UPI001B0BB998|nr:major tail protein [Ruminococcus sp.]MBO7436891.1 hypothetical protein [Bacteroidaceae bacterium]MBP5433269.1 hypothetical protein [Ruminococcus sp.]